MKIAILGATGPTGQALLKRALDAGHNVVALVRNPDGISTKHDNLQVEKTDISKEDTMVPALENCDVVMSCLGARGTFMKEVQLYSSSTRVIVSAMRKTNVKRFLCLTSWGLKHGEPRFVSWLLRSLFLKTIYADMARMEDYLESECQDINYTVVRPPSLSNGNSTEKQIQAREGQYVSNGGWSIPRTDVARFMLSCLDTDKWERKKVAISV
ncbi:hypothetical protein LOTGIDRAFT_145414 [Lottia gigantea]|uniref:NAD(P)-binding domain-containing protein n=1 Tax=Lottia gigantea TaxID=225164 RepID=V4ACX6_LOTGI|nr:hypothetical protein LOTGIDRAFT_145414 [Lottia gigantea]ESO92950.1 hypothetical protein LOTGIDRAFT_145414 [Lottia gigantea]